MTGGAGVEIHAGHSNLGRGMTQGGQLAGGGRGAISGPRPQPREETPAQPTPPILARPSPPPWALVPRSLLPAKPGPGIFQSTWLAWSI